jgi:hypothetical protein
MFNCATPSSANYLTHSPRRCLAFYDFFLILCDNPQQLGDQPEDF